MQIKQATAVRVPVRLTALATGLPASGVAFSDVTAYLQKQNGSSQQKTITGADWFEVDAVNMPGLYDVLLSASDTDTIGFFKYVIGNASSNIYCGLLEVVANITSDVIAELAITNGALLVNAVIDNVVYNSSVPPQVVSSRIRAYATAAEAMAPDSNTPVLVLHAADGYGPNGWTGETRTKG